MVKTKTVVVITEIVMILGVLFPVVCLLADCFDSAINGTILTGFGHGLGSGGLDYGVEAFFNTMAFDLFFGFVFVLMWIVWIVLTYLFTVFTVIYLRTIR